MYTTFFPPYSIGGDGILVRHLAEALGRQGHEVTVLHDIDAYRMLSGDFQEKDEKSNTNFNLVGLKCNFPRTSNLMTHQVGYPVVHGRTIKRCLESQPWDVIWFHNISLVGGIGLLPLGNAFKIYEAHEHWLVCATHVLWKNNSEPCRSRNCISCSFSYRRPPQLWRDTKRERNALNEIDGYIAKSAFSQAKHAEFGFQYPMTVIPCFLPDPAQDDHVTHHEISDTCKPYFLFVGRLEKIKGLDDVIPLFAEIDWADFLIIGTGSTEHLLRRQASGLSNVRFLGHLEPQFLMAYYTDAVALIAPSVCYETFGIVLIEAFRAGTPVIARNIGPFPEIIEQSEGGLLFDDVIGLKDRMHQLLNQQQLRSRLSRSAKTSFEKFWSESTVLSQYNDFIAEGMDRVDSRRLDARLPRSDG